MSPTRFYAAFQRMVAAMGDNCEHCGASWDFDQQPSVEAFELSGELVCSECADAIFEANSQFGVWA